MDIDTTISGRADPRVSQIFLTKPCRLSLGCSYHRCVHRFLCVPQLKGRRNCSRKVLPSRRPRLPLRSGTVVTHSLQLYDYSTVSPMPRTRTAICCANRARGGHNRGRPFAVEESNVIQDAEREAGRRGRETLCAEKKAQQTKHGPWGRALHNSAVGCRVPRNQVPELGKLRPTAV